MEQVIIGCDYCANGASWNANELDRTTSALDPCPEYAFELPAAPHEPHGRQVGVDGANG